MKRLYVFFVAVVLFTSLPLFAQRGFKLVERPIRFGMHHPSHPRKIDVVIIHSCYNPFSGDKYDLNAIIANYKVCHVSTHYIIDRQGVVYRLIKEGDISYHAGKSSLPDGRTWVNSCSLGIELVTSADSTDSPTVQQNKSLVALVNDIRKRYKIKYILRHSDIAPTRKTDPWNFKWEEFLKKVS